jgi:3-oxoacyl-[acyl-carrier protein] reductase
MDLGLKERVAVVTGGCTELGIAIARALCLERARVAICAREENRLREVADSLRRETGCSILTLTADAADPRALHAAIDEVVERWGRVDIAVANMIGPPLGGFDAATREHFERAVDLNVLSAVSLAKEVVPHMRRLRRGRFIAVSSVVAKQPVEGLILSTTVRAAMTAFVKSMATELAPEGILCNVVAPGFIRTAHVEEMMAQRAEREGVEPRDIVRELERQIPLGRLGTAEEVANLVAFLASDRASYISGAAMQVDGGFVRSVF